MVARRRYLCGPRLRTVREAVSEAAAAAVRGSGGALTDRFAVEASRRLGRLDIDLSRLDASVKEYGTDVAFLVRIPGVLDRSIKVRMPMRCVPSEISLNALES